MTNAEHVEVAIRAAQIAKSVLSLLDDRSILGARLGLADAATQFAQLDSLLAKIEAKEREG